jgi:hypothetical protein
MRAAEKMMKDKDLEIRLLQEAVKKIDPNFFAQNLTTERLREGCPDCKKKDSKLSDYEEHNRNLTEYIKKNSDRLGGDK